MIKQHFVLTIGRQYGSGGRTVGKMLAEELGIPFHDEDIITLTSERAAVAEEYLRLADEKAGKNIFYRMVDNLKPEIGKPKFDDNIVSPENLFRFQAEVIRELALEKSCIFAGRCANYILKEAGFPNLVNLFVHADLVTRIKRAMDYDKVGEQEALKRIHRIDRERDAYHKYYTGEEWLEPTNYDLMINASTINYDEMCTLMKDYLKMKG